MESPTHYIGIGASAGGLEAIEAFFKEMPPESNLAFIVVQHLSPDYKSLMVELLSKKTTMPVLRAEEGMKVVANSIYLIPPKKNLTIFHGRLLLKDKQSDQGINLPIDIFLRSLAEDQAERAIAIILSGTGSDGTRGVRAVKEFGGMVIVQDEESAKFDGMPRSAISTGVADFVLPPEEMPRQLMAYVSHPYVTGEKPRDLLLHDADALTRLFAHLREKTKVDFTYYKPSTVTRRIERRMSVNQISDFEEYVRYLQEYSGEVMALYRDLLIGVTSFFRDPAAMTELREKWLPDLFRRIKNREARFWVAGCSTGEEAYSLAILAKEAMEHSGISRDVKIFATDIDKDAIMLASSGIYPESIAGDLPAKIVAKYFYHKAEKLQIARHLREMVVFARHNLLKDPPFTNIDLVSCRNLLIYLQPVLQKKAFEMINFSLNPGGLLFLGKSETIGEMDGFFRPLQQKQKIYISRGRSSSIHYGADGQKRQESERESPSSVLSGRKSRRNVREGSIIVKRFLDLATQYYLPLTVIVNEQMNIVHIVGDTEGFFKIPAGPTDYDITKLARKELAAPLTTGIQKVFRTGRDISYTNLRLELRGEDDCMQIRMAKLPDVKGFEPLVAVFLEVGDGQQAGREAAIHIDGGQQSRQQLEELEQELQFARENLQATIEELETSNEELQATNEELLASNEELQSTNEELQSTNEELYTVNTEHQNKIIELTELNNDVENLLTSSQIGTMLLDEDLEVRKFSPEITNIFHVLEHDVGRPLSHITHRLVNVDPLQMVAEVVRSNDRLEKEVMTEDGRWYLARVLPYTIGPKTYAGVVMTFVEISKSKKIEENLASSIKTTNDISEYMPAGLFTYRVAGDNGLILESANPEAERLTGVSTEGSQGKYFEEIWPEAERQGIRQQFVEVMRTGKTCYLEEVEYDDGRLAGVYRIHAFRLPGKRLGVSFEDVTARHNMQKELEEREYQYRTLFETMAEGVVYQDGDGKIISANPAAEKILGLSLEQMRGLTSLDTRWQATDENGSPLPGEGHPAMVALRTCKPVTGFIMGVRSPSFSQRRWILVNATPQFREKEDAPYQVYTTFEDITEKYGLYAQQ